MLNLVPIRKGIKAVLGTCVVFMEVKLIQISRQIYFLYGWVFSIIWPDFSTSSSFTMLIFPRPGRGFVTTRSRKSQTSNLAIVIYTLSMKS